MKKYFIIFILISLLIIPSLGLAQTKFQSEEEQETQEQIDNIEEIQQGQPEGAGLILGETDLDLEKPKNLPGELTYSFQRLWENIVFVFTFQKINQIKYSLNLAEKRLAELNILLGRKKWQNAKNTINLYKKHIKKAKTIFENLKQDEINQISSDLKQDLINDITVLSIFVEDEDYAKVKTELNSALKSTLKFQENIGI